MCLKRRCRKRSIWKLAAWRTTGRSEGRKINAFNAVPLGGHSATAYCSPEGCLANDALRKLADMDLYRGRNLLGQLPNLRHSRPSPARAPPPEKSATSQRPGGPGSSVAALRIFLRGSVNPPMPHTDARSFTCANSGTCLSAIVRKSNSDIPSCRA